MARCVGIDQPLHGVVEGSGRRVVLLHPVGLDHTCWDGVVAELAATHRILRLDMRGHGKSPSAQPGMRLEDHADDVHAALLRFDFAPCALVGLSFGGMISQELALRHPSDIDALVLAGCSSGPSAAVRTIMLERAAEAERDGMQAIVGSTLQRWFTERFVIEGGAEETRKRLLATSVAGWAAAWRAIAAINTADRLGAIQCPVLCLAGELDVASPPPALQKFCTSHPGRPV